MQLVILTLRVNSYLVFPFCNLPLAVKGDRHSECLEKEFHLYIH